MGADIAGNPWIEIEIEGMYVTSNCERLLDSRSVGLILLELGIVVE
jgi:hypothetical protein